MDEQGVRRSAKERVSVRLSGAVLLESPQNDNSALREPRQTSPACS